MLSGRLALSTRTRGARGCGVLWERSHVAASVRKVCAKTQAHLCRRVAYVWSLRCTSSTRRRHLGLVV